MEGLDTFNEQAFGMLTTSKLAEALDLSKEDPRPSSATARATPRTATTAGRG